MANILSKVTNNIERDMYIDEIVKKYKISRGALLAEISNKIGTAVNETAINNVDMSYLVNKKESAINKRRKQEMYIIYILLSKDRKYINTIKNIIKEDDFENDDLKELYVYFKELDNSDDISKCNVLKYLTDDEKIKLVTEILCINIVDKDKFIEDLNTEMKKYRYEKRRNEILKRLSEKDVSKDERDMLSIELSQIIINKGKLK